MARRKFQHALRSNWLEPRYERVDTGSTNPAVGQYLAAMGGTGEVPTTLIPHATEINRESQGWDPNSRRVPRMVMVDSSEPGGAIVVDLSAITPDQFKAAAAEAEMMGGGDRDHSFNLCRVLAKRQGTTAVIDQASFQTAACSTIAAPGIQKDGSMNPFQPQPQREQASTPRSQEQPPSSIGVPNPGSYEPQFGTGIPTYYIGQQSGPPAQPYGQAQPQMPQAPSQGYGDSPIGPPPRLPDQPALVWPPPQQPRPRTAAGSPVGGSMKPPAPPIASAGYERGAAPKIEVQFDTPMGMFRSFYHGIELLDNGVMILIRDQTWRGDEFWPRPRTQVAAMIPELGRIHPEFQRPIYLINLGIQYERFSERLTLFSFGFEEQVESPEDTYFPEVTDDDIASGGVSDDYGPQAPNPFEPEST
jgi:hypothetical protein